MLFDKCRFLFMAVSLTVSVNANATFSIVAYDKNTNEYGAALASCVLLNAPDNKDTNMSDYITMISKNNNGIVTTQAIVNPFDNKNIAKAISLINENESASDVISRLTKIYDQDRNSSKRQYLVITNNGELKSAGYTGVSVHPGKGHIAGVDYVVAGNFLERRTINFLEKGFKESSGDLKRRLVSALKAVRDADVGDIRCRRYGVSSHTAFVKTTSESVFFNSQDKSMDAISGLISKLN